MLQKNLCSAEVVKFCSEMHRDLQAKDRESHGRKHNCAAACDVRVMFLPRAALPGMFIHAHK